VHFAAEGLQEGLLYSTSVKILGIFVLMLIAVVVKISIDIAVLVVT